jgi:hypothetical protein
VAAEREFMEESREDIAAAMIAIKINPTTPGGIFARIKTGRR